jgi:hypothetical protein
MANLPFRVWDIFQEVINNELPESCEVRIRAFYVGAHIVIIFCTDPEVLSDIMLARTKEFIRKYDEQYSLEEGDKERFAEILSGLEPTSKQTIKFTARSFECILMKSSAKKLYLLSSRDLPICQKL